MHDRRRQALIAPLFRCSQTQVQGLDTRINGTETRMQDLETRMLNTLRGRKPTYFPRFTNGPHPWKLASASHSATLRALNLEIETNFAAIKARLDEFEGRRPKH